MCSLSGPNKVRNFLLYCTCSSTAAVFSQITTNGKITKFSLPNRCVGEDFRILHSVGWATACSGIPERDGSDRGQDSPKQAGSCWFAHQTSHKWRELVSSGRLVCRCHGVFLWCYVCWVLLRFRLYAFVEAAGLRSIVLRYAGTPIATRVFLFLFFPVVYSEMSLFPSIFCTISAFSLYLLFRKKSERI